MYCTRCGTELEEQARFCTSCGRPVEEAEGAPAVASAVSQKNESKAASFKEAMDSSKRISRRRIPMIVLVALAMTLLSSAAFAAYQVYTHVIAPAIAEWQQEQSAQVEDENVATVQKKREEREEAESESVWVVDQMVNVSHPRKVSRSYSYDESGRLVSATVSDEGAETKWGFSYEEESNVIEKFSASFMQDPSYVEESGSTYEYDEEGRCVKEIRALAQGLPYNGYRIVYEYDLDGLLAIATVYPHDIADGAMIDPYQPYATYRFQYDGELLTTVEIDVYEKAINSAYGNEGDSVIKAEYDSGNCVKLEISSDMRKRIVLASYDEYGNLVNLKCDFGAGYVEEFAYTYKKIEASEGDNLSSTYSNPTIWNADVQPGIAGVPLPPMYSGV